MRSDKSISTLDKISSYMLLLFPAALVAGPFVAELLMNLISVFFLTRTFYNKNFLFLKTKFFLFFILFYFYILINSFYSDFTATILYKNLFYLRFILFALAVSALISINRNLLEYFYKFLMLTVFIVVIDAYVQYFFDYNTLGFPKYRDDRLSGFFNDELIIGSYLSRLLPLMFGLFFLNLKSLNNNEKFFSLIVFCLTFILIILSGERSATIISTILVVSLIFFINYSKLVKFLISITIVSLSIALFALSPKVLDRQVNQLIDQVNFKFSGKTFFSNFRYYETIYETAFNGFLDKKIIGQGAGSYRYFCGDYGIAHYSQKSDTLAIEDTLKYEKLSRDNIFLSKNNIMEKLLRIQNLEYYSPKVGPNGTSFPRKTPSYNSMSFEKDEILLTYDYWEENVGYETLARNKQILIYSPKNIKLIDADLIFNKIIDYTWPGDNGCTSHPHNFYLQLLGETGIVGLSFIIIISIYLLLILIKNKNKNNFETCLLIGFLLTLIPFLPNGNFFNNWINMIMYLPVGFYVNFLYSKNNVK